MAFLLALISSAAHATNISYRPLDGTGGNILWYLTDEKTGQCKAGQAGTTSE